MKQSLWNRKQNLKSNIKTSIIKAILNSTKPSKEIRYFFGSEAPHLFRRICTVHLWHHFFLCFKVEAQLLKAGCWCHLQACFMAQIPATGLRKQLHYM